MKYEVGDKVKIVDKRVEGMSRLGGMDEYFGAIMTIKSETDNEYKMIEDGGLWFWEAHMFEHKVKNKLREMTKQQAEKEFRIKIVD